MSEVFRASVDVQLLFKTMVTISPRSLSLVFNAWHALTGVSNAMIDFSVLDAFGIEPSMSMLEVICLPAAPGECQEDLVPSRLTC